MPATKSSQQQPRPNGRKKTAPGSRLWNHVQLSVLFLAVGFLLTLFIGSALYLFITLDIPDIDSLSSYKPATTTYMYDADNQPIARLAREHRTVVPLADMPVFLPQAFVAAEDARFYQHGGIDGWSIIRALLHNIRSGARGQGGSTITQQVARALLLTPEKTYTRKIKEAILAYRIDKALGKEEILHIYLNQIYLGSGAYGVEAAADIYFAKHARDLNLAEVALLAGLPQAPSRYSPFREFKLAKKRQAYVLNRMAEEEYITQEAARKAFEQQLFWGQDPNFFKENEYFIQHVKSYVENKYGSEMLLAGGLRIHTTLDQTMQKAASMAVKRGTAKWAVRQGSRPQSATLPQAALIAMDAETGAIKAMLGGTDFTKSQFNRATQARRQPGSAFKPVIFTAALEKGMTPATMIVDEFLQLRSGRSGEPWEPKNYDNTFAGPTSFRNALVHSRNIVTIKILQEIGPASAINLAKRLGVASPLEKNLSLALGSSALSPLELTRAYAPFANSGKLPEPLFVVKITDSSGKVLEESRPVLQQILDPRIAYQMTRIMQGVISEGTGRSVRSLGIPAAGKTGTTDQNVDAWFVGYTPELVASVWLGHDQNASLGSSETGGSAAAPIWLDFMQQIRSSSLSARDFPIPPGIVILPQDNATGLPGSSEGIDVSWEAFLEDNLPWTGNDTTPAPETEEPITH